jgi:hypothetical protein
LAVFSDVLVEAAAVAAHLALFAVVVFLAALRQTTAAFHTAAALAGLTVFAISIVFAATWGSPWHAEDALFAGQTVRTFLPIRARRRQARTNLWIAYHPVGLAFSKPFTARLQIARATHPFDAFKLLLAVTVALAAVRWIIDADEEVIVADHALGAVCVVATLSGLGPLSADTPIVDAFSVVAAITVVSTATVDLTTFVVQATLTITAVTVTAAILVAAFFDASVGLTVTGLPLRAGATVAAGHATLVGWGAHARLAVDLFALRRLWAIAIGPTADQAQPATRNINAHLTFWTGVSTGPAFTNANTLIAGGSVVAVTITAAPRKWSFTSPFNADLIRRTVPSLNASLDRPTIGYNACVPACHHATITAW